MKNRFKSDLQRIGQKIGKQYSINRVEVCRWIENFKIRFGKYRNGKYIYI